MYYPDTEMAIHDAKTAAFMQVEEVSQCCGTSITIEENMAEALTTHTVLSVTGCVRFFKIHPLFVESMSFVSSCLLEPHELIIVSVKLGNRYPDILAGGGHEILHHSQRNFLTAEWRIV